MYSELVHIDVHLVPPQPERDFHTLVTSGMSDRPMQGPDGPCHAELLISLPPDWPFTDEALNEDAHYWPIHWLRVMGHFAHAYETWLDWGHTVPNGDPPEPLTPNAPFTCLLLSPPLLAPAEFHSLEVGAGKTIKFLALTPLHTDEMKFKLKQGLQPLRDLFSVHGVTELYDPDRANLCKSH
jgi:hypothetical protein